MHNAASLLSRRSLYTCRRRLHQLANAKAPQITTLPNKIRVATESTPGHFASVGMFVDAGARYETPTTSGASHFIDRMAFKATESRSDEEMSRAMESLGGQIMCSSSRECISYQSSHLHRSTPLAVSLIADTVLNPSFLPNAISAQRDAARYEIREITAKPEMILPEVLHHVAYGGKTLGNPLLCPEDKIDLMDEHLLRKCMREWFTPDRIVIAGAGVQHEELVELVDKYFSSLRTQATPTSPSLSPRITASTQPIPLHALPSSNPSITKQLVRAASSYLFPSVTPYQADHASSPIASDHRSTASYTGGHHFLLDPSSEFNHVYVAFEGAGIHDDDVYTLATMQILLGGGGSFSAGGPGKGMYSRLYTDILNHYPQIDHCASFHHIYTDTSLFGIFTSVHPTEGSNPAQVFPHLLHQLSRLAYNPVKKEELLRAQSQLKSSLMMALESRPVEVEDLGRQILVHNYKVSMAETAAKIDNVTPATINQVAKKLFGPDSGNKPTIVCMGREDVDDWQSMFRKYGLAG